jgi:hypothetical protein
VLGQPLNFVVQVVTTMGERRMRAGGGAHGQIIPHIQALMQAQGSGDDNEDESDDDEAPLDCHQS